MIRVTRDPFRGRNVKGQRNKVTSKSSFSSEARPTVSGVQSDATAAGAT